MFQLATVVKPNKGAKSSIVKKVSFAAKQKARGGVAGAARKGTPPGGAQGTAPKVKPVLPGNAQTNKERKKEFRKLQRQRKRDGEGSYPAELCDLLAELNQTF